MVKISRVPSGFYTGKEASRRLGMSIGTFYKQVKLGKIKKHTPPGSDEGYYAKEDVEKLAQAKELFILLYSIEPTIFERATSEDDIRGIVDLCVAIYGVGGTPSIEARLAIWHKCPYCYYVLKQEGIVVGYISLIWFTDEALQVLMGPTSKQATKATSAGSGVYSITGPENIIPLSPGKPIDSLFISLGVRPGMSNQQQREYGFRLLRGAMEVLEEYARQGMPVHMLYGTSERSDGIMLARKMAMHEIKYPGDNLLRYSLDLETSDNPFAVQIRKIEQEQVSANNR